MSGSHLPRHRQHTCSVRRRIFHGPSLAGAYVATTSTWQACLRAQLIGDFDTWASSILTGQCSVLWAAFASDYYAPAPSVGTFPDSWHVILTVEFAKRFTVAYLNSIVSYIHTSCPVLYPSWAKQYASPISENLPTICITRTTFPKTPRARTMASMDCIQ